MIGSAFLGVRMRALHCKDTRAEGDGAGRTVSVVPVDHGGVIAERFSSTGIGERGDGLRGRELTFDGTHTEAARGDYGWVADDRSAVGHDIGGSFMRDRNSDQIRIAADMIRCAFLSV